ncbi:MAG: acetate/propionate family kinase [Ilumatobacteraceae bacterium]
MRILVVNAGSSSVKLRLLDANQVVGSADLAAGSHGFDVDAMRDEVSDWPAPDAIGHRIVHGGTRFTSPVRVNAEVRSALAALTELAPLHQPKSIAGLDAVTELFPDTPSVACFDTAFHATLPAEASTYPIPRPWRDDFRIRRYGFHGLSHAYGSRRAAAMLGRPIGDLRIVSCHLGAGASLAAVAGGRSIDTTMGFTPLDGLVMSTRSGAIDPGIVLWLLQHGGLSVAEVERALEHESGLSAFGGTGDMRAVVAAAESGGDDAALAIAVYVHRLAAAIGSMTASLGGLDALLFTGGVGEHSPLIRARTTDRLRFLGIEIDDARNLDASGDTNISAVGSAVATLVIEAREDLQIARDVVALIG